MLPTARLTLADILRGYARSRGDALCLGDGDRRLSWRATDERVNRCANALAAAGVGRGDRVLWLGQNSFRVQELLLACCKLGALFCPANWRQQPDELAFVIDDLEPRVVIGQEEEVGPGIAAARERAQAAGAARWLVHDVDGRDDAYEAFVHDIEDAADPERDGSADDPLLLVYTAAFSGRPNAAMLSSRALVAQGLLMAPWQDFDEHTVFLNSGPLFHIGTFMPNLSSFVVGGANVFVARVVGEDLCRAIAGFGCTAGFVIGPMVDAIVEANADGRYDLSTFRGHRGNAAFDAMVSRDASRWGRNPGGYGQTEVMGMATFTLLAGARPGEALGTHGRPSPLVQVRVVDDDDIELPPGEVGEIVVRGATVMNGYWNRPEENRARSRGGWHHTHDLGRFEADGSFAFIAPKSRMLKSAAENIYPAEVEHAIRSHPGVADCAVIGVPDDVWVQSVTAVVVRAEGHDGLDAETVIEWCRARIASYKKPRRVEFVDELPRAGFAVDYDELDRRFGGGGYPGGTTRSA